MSIPVYGSNRGTLGFMGKTSLHSAQLVAPAPEFSGDLELKAYWKFNESSGAIINQSEASADLGSNADIAMTGGTYGETGIIGDAVLFDGTDDFGQAGTSVSQWKFLRITNALSTVACWMNFVSVNDGFCCSFNDGDIGNSAGYNWILKENSAQLQIKIRKASGGGNTVVDMTTTDLQTGWHLYISTFDEALGSNELKLKVDNANLRQESNLTSSNTANSANPMQLGKRSGFVGDFMTGTLDEFSVWDKVMSDDDQTALYNDGVGLEIY